MKLFPPLIVRYYIKYISIVLLFLLPVLVIFGMNIVFIKVFLLGNASVYKCIIFGFVVLILTLMMGFAILIFHTSIWEKCWSVLHVSNDRFVWKCPFRKNRIILFSEAKEIGVYKENKNNGISKDKIYISMHRNPLQYINKRGELIPSASLIVFWATKENIDTLIALLPRNMTGKLVYFRIQQKK